MIGVNFSAKFQYFRLSHALDKKKRKHEIMSNNTKVNLNISD